MFSLKRVLLVGAIAALLVSATTTDANACWWWRGCAPAYYTSCCYYPTTYYYSCYTPTCCDGYYGSAWYVGVRPGPVRRLLLGPYRYYWAGNVYYYGGYCSYISTCCDGGAVVTSPSGSQQPTPAQPAKTAPVEPSPTPMNPTPADAPAAPNPPTSAPSTAPLAPPAGFTPANPTLTPPTAPSSPFTPPLGAGSFYSPAPSPTNSGLLTIYVPADAKVTVNGHVTKSTGTKRQYVSYGLQPGLSYKYEIKAEVVRDGQVYDEVRTVVLTAGARNTVAFSFHNLTTGSLAAN